MCSTAPVRINNFKKLIKENKYTVRRGNLRGPIRTSQPERKRGGDGDRDACRRPCCFFSRALALSLECSLKFTLLLMFPCSLVFTSSPSSFFLSPSSSSCITLSLSPLPASVSSIIYSYNHEIVRVHIYKTVRFIGICKQCSSVFVFLFEMLQPARRSVVVLITNHT